MAKSGKRLVQFYAGGSVKPKGYSKGGVLSAAKSTKTADMGAGRCYKEGGKIEARKSGGRLDKFNRGGNVLSPGCAANPYSGAKK
jgi:hypothetical protein